MSGTQLTDSQDRLQSLDTLRGFALLGILLVNALQMFIPAEYANLPVAVLDSEAGVWSAWFVLHSLFDLKFLALFSMLFGAGFMLHWYRHSLQPSSFRWLYWRRLLLLALFGIGHALWLYSFDVLFLYAVCGGTLYLCRNWSVVTMITTGTTLFMLTVLELYLLEYTSTIYALQSLACVAVLIGSIWLVRKRRPLVFSSVAMAALAAVLMIQFWLAPVITEPGSELVELQQVANQLSAMPDQQLQTSIADYRLPLNRDQIEQIRQQGDSADQIKLEQTAYRAGPQWLRNQLRADTFTDLIIVFLFYFSWRTLGLFLLAAGLVKWGILKAQHADLWRTTAKLGLGFGLPLSLLATGMSAAHYLNDLPWLSFGRVLHELSSIFIATGIAAGFLLWGQGERLDRLKTLLASAGRMALSNYIGQSLVMMILANQLGWFGQLSRWNLMLLALSVFVLLALLSNLWLNYYRIGPLEWLWRCGTYRQWVPLRNAPATVIKGPSGAGTDTNRLV